MFLLWLRCAYAPLHPLEYVRCLYVYNKADAVTIEDVDRLARLTHSIVISCNASLNLDRLLDRSESVGRCAGVRCCLSKTTIHMQSGTILA